MEDRSRWRGLRSSLFRGVTFWLVSSGFAENRLVKSALAFRSKKESKAGCWSSHLPPIAWLANWAAEAQRNKSLDGASVRSIAIDIEDWFALRRESLSEPVDFSSLSLGSKGQKRQS